MKQDTSIAVFGLGYVGTVSAACMAELGHHIVGVDINPDKVACVAEGRSPIVEEGLEELLTRAVQNGRLSATTDAAEAVRRSAMAWLCVSTPSRNNGSLDVRYLERVSEQIGATLAERRDRYVIVVRSTALPGTTENRLVPILERASTKRAGEEFGVCYHPEFLREGSAVEDFRDPPKIVIGADEETSANALAGLYKGFDAPVIRTSISTAEMVKYCDNAWHALKIGFANEMGTIAKRFGIDGREVMEIFCRDRKLNLSEMYLRPAFAFGGSCLPKDVRALAHRAGRLDLELPILGSVLPSNASHVERGYEIISRIGKRRVGLLGLSFKPGTDDLRESPLVDLAERLIGKGYDLKIFDHNVNLSRLVGANREYIQRHIPHLSALLVDDPAKVVEHADTIVVGNDGPGHREQLAGLPDGKVVVDLVGIGNGRSTEEYHGICW